MPVTADSAPKRRPGTCKWSLVRRWYGKPEVVRTLMRLAVTGRLVETEHKYRLASLHQPDQG